MINFLNLYPQNKSLLTQLILFLELLNFSTARLFFGQCLHPPTVQNFQAEEFFNRTWYEIASCGNLFFQGTGTCSGMASRITSDGQVILKTYNYQPISGTYVSIDGTSHTQYILNRRGSLPIKFGIWGGLLQDTYQAYIPNTDYVNFAVIYLCQQKFFFKSEMAYVMSRVRAEITGETSSRVSNALQTIGLTESDTIRSINSNCGADEPTV